MSQMYDHHTRAAIREGVPITIDDGMARRRTSMRRRRWKDIAVRCLVLSVPAAVWWPVLTSFSPGSLPRSIAFVVMASVLTCAVVIAAHLARSRFVVISVRGRSMEPTYRDGSRVLVDRRTKPRPGQVVVTEWLEDNAVHEPPLAEGAAPRHVLRRDWMIKRMVAMAGSPVPREALPSTGEITETVVPDDCVVLVGDNRAQSIDSRQRGYFRAARILGVVVRTIR